MPSSLFTLDSELPTFSGRESPQEQNRKMFNYLVQMKQSLQYTLRNLTTDNFTKSALQSLTDSAKVELSDKLTLMQNALTQLNGKMDSISGRISGMEGVPAQIESLSDTDELLAREIATLQEAFWGLVDAINGEGGILYRLEQVEKVLSVITIGEDGAITIGAEGVPLYLVGQVYMDGTAEGETT